MSNRALWITMIAGLVMLALVGSGNAEGAVMGVSATVLAFARAIARQEGWNVPGSKSRRANNPGNLHAGNVGNGTIQDGITGQITIYGSESDGWSALYTFVIETLQGRHGFARTMTLAEYGARYSGNDPQWARNVSTILGVAPSTLIGDVLYDV